MSGKTVILIGALVFFLGVFLYRKAGNNVDGMWQAAQDEWILVVIVVALIAIKLLFYLYARRRAGMLAEKYSHIGKKYKR